MRFSIIIPAHNEEKYISHTLKSLENQSFSDFEIVVVANGCSDATEEVAKKKAPANTRVLSLPNPNVCVARNAGALNAQGEILLFLDADTRLAKDALEKINAKYSQDHGVGSTRVKLDTGKIHHNTVMGIKNLLVSTKLFKGFGGALICSREDFHAVQGYDPECNVGEHKRLRKKLEQRGPYVCYNTKVTTSARRYHNWSLAKTTTFWAKHILGKNEEYEKFR